MMNTILLRLRRPLVITIAMAGGVYLGGIILADGGAVLNRLAALSPATILVALLLPTLAFLTRFSRWTVYLKALGHVIPWATHLRIYLAGFALTATPGKVGENFRALLLQPYGVPASDSIAAFVTERLADLTAMTLLSSLALRLASEHSWWLVLTSAVIIGVVAGVRHHRLPEVIERRVTGRGWFAHTLQSATRFLRAAQALLSLRLLGVGVGAAILAWSMEAWTFGFLARAMGISIAIPTAMGIFAVATLLGAVSFLPGGVGPTEAVMVGLLLVSGASLANATAVTVLIRAVTLWWAILLGVVAASGIRSPSEARTATVGEARK